MFYVVKGLRLLKVLHLRVGKNPRNNIRERIKYDLGGLL